MSQLKTKFITDNAVTNAKLAQAPTLTIKGNDTGGTANEKDLTVAEVKAMLGAGSASGLATLDASGLVPITQIPPAALERLVVVADQTARYALTTATVQNGDTVKQTDTGEMFFIIDDTNLGNSAGYAVYSAGTASSVAWSGITGIPAPVSALLGTNTGDVVIGTANGLSISNQTISMALANGSVTGTLSASDYNTFNAKLTSVLAPGEMFIGNNSSVASAVVMSGDVTIDSSGVTTIGALKVTAGKMSSGAATSGQVATADGSGNVSYQSPAATVIVTEEMLTLSGGDITAQYIDLAHVAQGSSASANSISLNPVGGPEQLKAVDYTVSLTGGAGGVTRITFAGDLATGGPAALIAGDILMIKYAY